MTLKNILSALIVGMIAVGCTDPLDVDTSGVKLDLDYINLDSILYKADSVELMENHRDLQKEIANIYSYQLGYCMQIQSPEDSTVYNAIQEYRQDTFIMRLERNINNEFSDLSQSKEKLTDGFKHLKYHFPKESMPEKIVFMNSLFNSSVWCSDKGIAIGLERYLGGDNECVQRLNPITFHEWIKADMDKQYMERDALMGWIQTNLMEEADGTLAEKIVYWGKVIQLTKAAYPKEEDYWILRYTKEELEWAEENKHAFWKYLVDEKMLFESNERNAMNLLNPGPTTPGLPESGGPDRLGQYLGWLMVKSYLEQYDVSMQDLVDLPYNEILQEFELGE